MSLQTIRDAVDQLDQLARTEYGVSLEEVLLDADQERAYLRLQRLTGISLKMPFSKPGVRPEHSATGAHRSWIWLPEEPDTSASSNAQLLAELRKPGSWNERSTEQETPWREFIDDVDHERGLFKVVALWVKDKIDGVEGKSLREYFDQDETRRFEAGLDAATLVFNLSVTTPLLGLVGVPEVAVGLALIGCQFGFRKLSDPIADRLGDQYS